ncbi:hypothetical protein GPECTOR_11g289 [Gonium pectorale]|uniref:Ankyrin repeat domain-containing protein n=1 Tax=Gonium pectorale TaxID=33097 RepID=A0A150GR88_GONPE|nr:hypothetical protein GPECTOR_11g289 [Gonium pectorale]|eukprot:KXZ51850.1 hypothetical protein GPECTOR_11g289 [Gonium pectorale]
MGAGDDVWGCSFDKGHEALHNAARYGHRQLCEWLLREANYPWTQNAVGSALRGGHVELAGWLLQQRPPGSGGPHDAPTRRKALTEVMMGAAYGCGVETLKRLHRELLEPAAEDSSAAAAAAGSGDRNGPADGSEEESGSNTGASGSGGSDSGGGEDGGGHEAALLLLRTLALHEGDGPLSEQQCGAILANAAGCWTADWVAKVEWLEAQGYPKTAEAAGKVARWRKPLERLRWLRERGFPLDQVAVTEAAFKGDVPALQYLLAEGAPSSDDAVSEAIRKNHLSALQAIHAAGRPIDGAKALMAAALRGHVHILAWLVGESGLAEPQQLLGNAKLFAQAAQSGSIETMEWLQQRGCSWWEEGQDGGQPRSALPDLAAAGGHEPSIEWLVERGCPVPDDGKPYVSAGTRGDLATLRCLRRLAVPWGWPGDAFRRCVSGGADPEVLRWLVAEGCSIVWARALEAARARSEEAEWSVRWLMMGERSWEERQWDEYQAYRRQGAATVFVGGNGGGAPDATTLEHLRSRVAELERELQVRMPLAWGETRSPLP